MAKAAEAYPLQWPTGVKRTPAHKRAAAQFGKKTSGYVKELNVIDAVQRVQREMDSFNYRAFRVRGLVLSTNVELRLDGLPYANRREPDDPGVCLYFDLDGKPHALPCDKWNRVADNIAAIAAHVGAVRGMERWGVADVAQMFAGFAALPAPQVMEAWWDVFGVSPEAPNEVVAAAYRALAVKAHPDQPTGSHEAMARLNMAKESWEASKMVTAS